MTEEILKELFGFSNNKIYLIKTDDRVLVRKLGNIQRNVERMLALKGRFLFPEIYSYSDNCLELEYIHSLDIKTYLLTNKINDLTQFLFNLFDSLAEHSVEKDYTQVYIDKLGQIEFNNEIIFTKDELLEKLPKILPQSEYFGDLTLENILYSKQKGFVLIDCQTVEYDSFIFDIAKLRQDLECKWFLRSSATNLDIKLSTLQTMLLNKYPQADNTYLLILMLLRIYRYATDGSVEQTFLLQHINRLWLTTTLKGCIINT